MLFTEKRHQSLKECPVLIYDPHHLLSKVTRVVRKSFASISARVMNTLMSCISQNELISLMRAMQIKDCSLQ
jgi:hypothetical protein